jgi:hypothetical protein
MITRVLRSSVSMIHMMTKGYLLLIACLLADIYKGIFNLFIYLYN